MGSEPWEYGYVEAMQARMAEEEKEIREYANDLLEGREPIYFASDVRRMVEENGKFYAHATLELLTQAEKIYRKRQKASQAGVKARQKIADKDLKHIKALLKKHGADSTHETIQAGLLEDYPDDYKKDQVPSISKISRLRSKL